MSLKREQFAELSRDLSYYRDKNDQYWNDICEKNNKIYELSKELMSVKNEAERYRERANTMQLVFNEIYLDGIEDTTHIIYNGAVYKLGKIVLTDRTDEVSSAVIEAKFVDKI